MPSARNLRYLGSPHYRRLLGDRDYWVVDGGSRGEVFAPFDQVAGNVSFIAFEPDASAERRKQDESRTVWVTKALWNRSEKISLHLAVSPSTSSVYPPNMPLLARFRRKNGTGPRTTDKIIELDAISIDDAVSEGLCPAPQFIKLDVHSAEYEALEGATKSLQNALGVLVETWHSPIHKGQKLHADVEQLLNSRGYYLFSHRHAAAWKHEFGGSSAPTDVPRVVASESLFFREFGDSVQIDLPTAVFAIATADLFDQTTYAILLARQFAQQGVFSSEFGREIESELLHLSNIRNRQLPSLKSIQNWMKGLRRAFRGRAA